MDDDRGGDERSWAGVLDAGRVLFGPRAEAVLGGGGWRKELRRAYRRRALETHPDRARSLGRAEADLVREFRAVVDAYHFLLVSPERASSARARPRAPASGPPPRRAASPAPHSRKAEAAGGAHPQREPPPRTAGARPRGTAARAIPGRRLRLAEFLHYSGRIPFEALVEAVAWQRRQRPPVGRIAVECGFLTYGQVLEVMERRSRAGAHFVPFAEYATRIGLLTPFARLAVLGRQRKRQRRIGRFFVERGWLSEEELTGAALELLRHNLQFGGAAR